MEALGFIEISGTTAAIDALDIMCKTSGAELVTWERKLGGRLVTIVITGKVSQVTESIEAVKANCFIAPVATLVLPNPHPETVKMVELSAARLKRKTTPSDTSRIAPDMEQSESVDVKNK